MGICGADGLPSSSSFDAPPALIIELCVQTKGVTETIVTFEIFNTFTSYSCWWCYLKSPYSTWDCDIGMQVPMQQLDFEMDSSNMQTYAEIFYSHNGNS